MAFSDTTRAVNAAKKQPKGGVIGEINRKLAEKQKDSGKSNEAEVTVTKLGGRPVGPKNPSRDVQPTLPGTEEGLPKIPASIKRLLPRHLATILERARLSKQEADERKEIGNLMIKHEVKKVQLENGAYLVLEHIEDDKIKYVPAKEKKPKPTEDVDDSEDDEDD